MSSVIPGSSNKQSLPKALFLADNCPDDYIVKRILDVEELPEKECPESGHPWKINTKYYNTVVDLCPFKSTDEIPDDFFTLCEAFVIYFNDKHADSFQNIKNWVSNKQDYLPDVLLLISDSLDNKECKVKKKDVDAWCIENKFELIELDTKENETQDDYAIIPEKFGIDRIIEALTVHMWSNLEMVPKQKNSRNNSTNESPKKSATEAADLEDSEDFYELLSRLHSMKEGLQSLPWRERQQGAENLVKAFLAATGDIDDDDFDPDLG